MHLIEPVAVADTFCSGLSHIEPIGLVCVRFVCYVEQAGETVLCARIVMPVEAVPPAVVLASGFLAKRTVRQISDFLPRAH